MRYFPRFCLMMFCFPLILNESMDSDFPESDYFPGVMVHRSLVTHKLCNEIVAEAECLGFQNEFESIDQDLYDIEENQSSQDLHIYESGFILSPILWTRILPIISNSFDLIHQHYGPTTNSVSSKCKEEKWRLDWIFLRKYGDFNNSTRNQLIPHQDSSIVSMTIPLNYQEEYGQGGLFFMKLHDLIEVDQSCDTLGNKRNNNINSSVPDDFMRTYDWLETVKRKNTSLLWFPEADAGAGFLYQGAIWHGVAPVTDGTRYSMSMFFNIQSEDYHFGELFTDTKFVAPDNKIIDGTYGSFGFEYRNESEYIPRVEEE